MKIKILLVLLLMLISSIYAQTTNPTKVSLQLQWKHQFQFAGFYIAKEKGFYSDVNLDVEIKEFDFGINIVEDISSKKTTFGTNYPSLILEKSKGKDIVLLSAILQSSPHALITLKSSGIESLKDFKNKTLMIDKGAISAAPFVSMLQSNKVSFEDIYKVPHSFDIDDLVNEKVDISTIFTTNEPYYLNNEGIEYNIWDPKEYGFDFYDVLLFTSSYFIENDPKMVEDFRDASLKGWEYAFANIDETIELILKKYNSQNRTKDALRFEATELKKLAYYKSKKLGAIDSNSIQRIFDIYNLLGLTQNKIELDDFIYKSSNDLKALKLTKEEKSFIKQHPIIKVGGEMDWPPFDYVENGEYTGIAKDYLDLISKYTGLKFDVKTGYTWDELLQMAKNKELDLMPMIYHTKEREKYFNYTNEYLTVRNYLFSSKNNSDEYEKLEDLNGKIVALPKGFAQINILKQKYPKIKILETQNVLASIDALITNKADAMIENIALVNYLLKSNNIQGIKSDFTVNIGANSIFMTSRKDWPILRNIIQKGLDSINAEDKITIVNKWMKIEDNSEPINITREEKDYLQNNSFNVYLNNWLPISMYNEKNDEFSGLSLDYWNIITEFIPIKDNLIYSGGFLNSINKLKNDKNGIMISLSYTEDRTSYGTFSKPYASYPIGIATKDNKKFILDLIELEGKKIAVGKNYSAHKLLQKHYPKIEFVPVKNTIEALELLAQGKVYGAADILFTLKYYLQKYSYTNLKIAGTSDFKFDIRIMVNKENANLIPIIDKAIDKISDDERKIFQNKWIQTINQVEKIDYTMVYGILVIFILTVLFLLWRHKELSKYKNELEERTKQLYDYVEASTDFVWEVNKDGVYINVSDKVEDILGYKPEEVIGKSPFEFMSEDEALRVSEIFKETITKRIAIVDLQNQNIHKNGSSVLLLTNGVPIFKNDEFIGYRGTDKDITKEKEQEHLILQQSKMASMGEMIANISHQWRQPLSIISTVSSSYKMKKELGLEIDINNLVTEMNKINENAQYLSRTIDDFKNFIRGDRKKVEFSLNKSINSFLNLVEGTIKNNDIEVILDIDNNININGYENELIQCLINIFNNAKDALLENNIEEKYIFISILEDRKNVIIKIKDNAGGIKENIIARIFEPYFTTKHQSQGTGLGLHMTYKLIIEGMNGTIIANNITYNYKGKEYTGAEFTINLLIK